MMILHAAAIAVALSLDAFAAGFAYGSSRIEIPMRSIQTINLICSAVTGAALFMGNILQQYIPRGLTVGISFAILFLLGMAKLLDSITKSIIRKHSQFNREVEFSFLNFRFILTLYADPEKADIDRSKILTPRESTSLALALSLDGIAVGFGAALGGVNVWAVFVSTWIAGMAALFFGCQIGNRIVRKMHVDLSWLGGGILIIMAIIKLF